ncbi:hypothetical protein FisN_14Lh107 [Fistulifera solaris]|uniref:Cation/H+ exchanger transmembrane domain-containing protein n=1 Tax=Fistulifera solaris TaxID=1519565 RepID=A0A1Z5J9D7_FISSO|nr:hypothetical protein FisN_14Lh107 [Fistulifera solaris]|eukprot:GAX10605.1 hypothetical protein FisN_14Lh107 [Fistulifera solaris]
MTHDPTNDASCIKNHSSDQLVDPPHDTFLCSDPTSTSARAESHRFRCSRRILLSLVGSFFVALFFYNNSPRTIYIAKDNDNTHDNDSFVYGPPVDLPQGETLVSRHRRRAAAAKATNNKKKNTSQQQHAKKSAAERAPIPVVQFEDSQLPGFFFDNTPQTAAEVLACKDSVLNYVINATDTKDECDGLTKAFEKTCHASSKKPEQQRRLRDKLKTQQRVSYWMSSRYHHWVSAWMSKSSFFFADEAVVDYWEHAALLVDYDLEDTVNMQSIQRRILGGKNKTLFVIDMEEDETEPELLDATEPPKVPAKPISLQVPLGGVSEETLDIIHTDAAEIQEESMNQTVAKVEVSPPKNVKPVVTPSELKSRSKDAAVPTKKTTADPPYEPNSREGRICCVSILNVYQENCSPLPEDDVSDRRLLFVVFVMAMCCILKSLIRHFKILWLPEAAGCILVGVMSGYILMIFPHHDVSFDGNWFLRILVPPIIFEAALGIDKRSFHRHLVPILLYAIAGTLMATVLTAFIVHRGTFMMGSWCPTIPYVEALVFGSLISSIDPIAVLSVLSNMGMTDTDTVYVIIFGESLLNDGVAIVLFHTLEHFLDETLVIDSEALTDAAIHFFVVAFGSLLVGVVSGMMATIYFWQFYQCQTPLVEVLMFLCWALVPYYICDGIGWSGIVCTVATGFFMDMHIVGQKRYEQSNNESSENSEEDDDIVMTGDTNFGRRPIFSSFGHLSEKAKEHIGFVAELIAATMETAIFAYLGLFLFSHRYHWNVFHAFIAIIACCASRGIMIPFLSLMANWITRAQQLRSSCQRRGTRGAAVTNAAGVIIDRRMQMALWFAGLRGAMSFALVEHIPLFDEETREGSRLKPELKAMTSASILFSVFLLGGSTYYVMEHLGIAPQKRKQLRSGEGLQEMVELISTKGPNQTDGSPRKPGTLSTESSMEQAPGTNTTFRRARHGKSPLEQVRVV